MKKYAKLKFLSLVDEFFIRQLDYKVFLKSILTKLIYLYILILIICQDYIENHIETEYAKEKNVDVMY